jgi:hypothetical protein
MTDHGLKVRSRYMIIDAAQFSGTFGEGTLAWRDEHIVPFYNDAGAEKFAFITAASMPGIAEKGAAPAPEGPATFPTGWFETRERMYAWLTGGVT